MSEGFTTTRRRALQLGAVGGVAALASGALTTVPAWGRPGAEPVIKNFGPGVVQFGSKSALQVGDTIYIGSRNIEPTYVAAFHLPTRTVVATAEIPDGRSIQGMDVTDDGQHLYFAIENPAKGLDTVYRWDLTDTDQPAEPLGRAGDVTIWNMSLTPDGYAYFGGKEEPPHLWQYDPTDGSITAVGTPEETATGVRSVLATETTVFVGSGTVMSGSDETSSAVLAAYDRATGEMTQILPPELGEDETVRSLALAGDSLIVGTYGGGVPSKIAVLDVNDPSSYRWTEVDGVTTKALLVNEDDLFLSTEANTLRRISLSTLEVTPIEVDGLDFGEVWGMGWQDGLLHVVSAYGFVAHVDVAAGTAELTGLIDAGAPSEPQLAMSVTVGDGFAYVAANGLNARHSIADGEVENLIAPGETKHGLVAGGIFYMAQYSGLGLYGYDPSSEELPRQLAKLPPTQNRPVFVTWDDVNRRVLVTTQSDVNGGGSVGVYDPETDDMQVHVNPLDQYQLIRWATCHDGVTYLGGDNVYDTGPRGEVAAFDPLSGEVLWRIDPQQEGGVSSMALYGDHLYVSTNRGGICIIDVTTQEIVHTADVSRFGRNRSSLGVAGGRVHAVTDSTLFRFDPQTFEATAVVPELNGKFYGGHTKMDTDETGRIYTLQERDLVQIEVPAFPVVDTEVTTRREGRNVMLRATVTNTESFPVTVTVTTPFGTQERKNVGPGQSIERPFLARGASVEPGEITVETTAAVAGHDVTSTIVLPFDVPQ